ncbi:TOBE domain-containing protein [uncultured Paludibacter sp.]|uniref:TOBE domain-containing protein n=1 Tax=uncultured Paludibacter sp. TaxID=497635 RepID=A0A653AAK1_9BACT|nr:TOBE domain-containing protein [uncultured Paludibacter sp.]
MKVSTRNQLKGTISAVYEGAINSEIEISISESVKIVAVITNGAVKNLDLKVGSTAYALIKSSNVIIGIDFPKISARNIFAGRIISITEGVVNDEIELTLGNGITITAIITKTSVKNLELSVGKEAYAIVKASSVIVGVDD